jgi:hypothetical protein
MRALGLILALAWGASAACAACTSSSTGATPADAGPADTGPTVTCDNDSRVDTYVANLAKTSTSGALKVTLMGSDPVPPARGTNAWTVKVEDGSGNAIPDAALEVTPFMPDHGHGTSVRPVITPKGDGTYTIDPLYLFMPGVWRITIALPATDAGPGESVAFFFCVAG